MAHEVIPSPSGPPEPWRGPLRAFLTGAAWPLRGARILLGRPGWWPLVAVPALLTSALLITSLVVVVRGAPWLLGTLWPLGPGASVGATFLWWLLAGLLIVSVGTAVAVGTWLVSGLIATPFLDQLSDHVEREHRGVVARASGWTVFLVDIGWSIVHTSLALLLWAVSMLALMLVGLIPVVGPPAELVLSLLVTGWLVAREMMDGPMSRRGFAFRQKLRVVWSNRATALGFGLVVASLLWLPLLNFLVLPVAVVGGTRMFLDLEDRGLVPPPDRA